MKPAVVAFTAAAILILVGWTVPAILLALGGLAVLALDIAGPPRCRCHFCSAVFPQGDPPMTTPENWDAEVNNREVVERVVRGEASL